MKIILDIISIALFFITYTMYDIFYATGVMMLTYTIIMLYSYISTKKLDKTIMATWLLVVLLGSLTLFFHNAVYIKYKPTVIYLLFAIIFHVSPYLKDEKSIMERLAGHDIQMPSAVWANLNKLWICFFYILSILNIYIAYNFTEKQWVYFKTFGTLSLLFVITVIQVLYMAKFIKKQDH